MDSRCRLSGRLAVSLAVAPAAASGADPGRWRETCGRRSHRTGGCWWTSSGADLLAYRTGHVSKARAAPGGTPIRAVRRVAGAVPPAGVTGAAFYGDRLMLARQDDTLFQVWSVDPATGGRRLEIERRIAGESEGLDVIDALGGVLHGIVTPIELRSCSDVRRRQQRAAALRAYDPPPDPAVGGRASRAGRGAAGAGDVHRHDTPERPAPAGVAGAQVRPAGARARTSARGTARLSVRITPPGRYRATASRANLRAGAVTLRVVAATPEACVRSLAAARVARS